MSNLWYLPEQQAQAQPAAQPTSAPAPAAAPADNAALYRQIVQQVTKEVIAQFRAEQKAEQEAALAQRNQQHQSQQQAVSSRNLQGRAAMAQLLLAQLTPQQQEGFRASLVRQQQVAAQQLLQNPAFLQDCQQYGADPTAAAFAHAKESVEVGMIHAITEASSRGIQNPVQTVLGNVDRLLGGGEGQQQAQAQGRQRQPKAEPTAAPVQQPQQAQQAQQQPVQAEQSLWGGNGNGSAETLAGAPIGERRSNSGSVDASKRTFGDAPLSAADDARLEALLADLEAEGDANFAGGVD